MNKNASSARLNMKHGIKNGSVMANLLSRHGSVKGTFIVSVSVCICPFFMKTFENVLNF